MSTTPPPPPPVGPPPPPPVGPPPPPPAPPAPEGGGRRRIAITLAIVTAVVVAIVAVAIGVSAGDDDDPAPRASSTPTRADEPGATSGTDQAAEPGVPRNVGDDFNVVYSPGGAAEDRVVVTMYEDFLCPACGAFEQSNGEALTAAAERGDVALDFRPYAFLHAASSNDYSARAWNAAACVVDEAGPEAFMTFHATLFANQPPEGGAGPEDPQLLDWAEQAGARDVETCIADQQFTPWVEDALERGQDDGVTGTPTVRIDGKDVNGDGGTIPLPADVQRAIDAARQPQGTST